MKVKQNKKIICLEIVRKEYYNVTDTPRHVKDI